MINKKNYVIAVIVFFVVIAVSPLYIGAYTKYRFMNYIDSLKINGIIVECIEYNQKFFNSTAKTIIHAGMLDSPNYILKHNISHGLYDQDYRLQENIVKIATTVKSDNGLRSLYRSEEVPVTLETKVGANYINNQVTMKKDKILNFKSHENLGILYDKLNIEFWLLGFRFTFGNSIFEIDNSSFSLSRKKIVNVYEYLIDFSFNKAKYGNASRPLDYFGSLKLDYNTTPGLINFTLNVKRENTEEYNVLKISNISIKSIKNITSLLLTYQLDEKLFKSRFKSLLSNISIDANFPEISSDSFSYNGVQQNNDEKLDKNLTNLFVIVDEYLKKMLTVFLTNFISSKNFTRDHEILQNIDLNIPYSINNREMLLLSHAIYYDNLHAAKILIKNNANLYAQDKDGNTPLHHLAKFGSERMIKFLLAKKPEFYISNNFGENVIDVLVSNNERFEMYSGLFGK